MISIPDWDTSIEVMLSLASRIVIIGSMFRARRFQHRTEQSYPAE